MVNNEQTIFFKRDYYTAQLFIFSGGYPLGRIGGAEHIKTLV